MTERLPNDGSGVELALKSCSPMQELARDGVRIYYLMEHPLPVISREVFRETRRVMDATVGFTNQMMVDRIAAPRAFLWMYEGDCYSPGLVTEDGLTMPCLWV